MKWRLGFVAAALASLWALSAHPQNVIVSGVYGDAKKASGGGACSPGAHATAYLARGTFNATYQAAFCTLINGLDSNSLFSTFDALFMLGNQSSANAALNLIGNTFVPTVNGSPTFTANKGYQGADASLTQYIDTNLVAAVTTTQCTTNSCSLLIVIQDNLQASALGGQCVGYSTGLNNIRLFPWYSDGNQYYDIIDSTQNPAAAAVSSSKGRYVLNRSGNTATQFYMNGSPITTGTTTATVSPGSGDIYVLAGNGGTGATFGCGNFVGAYGIGSSLTSGQVSTLDSLLSAFGTAVGWP